MKEINLNKRGKYGSAKDKALSPNRKKEILNKLTDDKDRVIFILGAFAGLRVGEMQQLRSDWLEETTFSDKNVLAIHVPNECRDINNKYKIWRPKTKRGRTTYIFDKNYYSEIKAFFKYNDSIGLSMRGLQERSYRIAGVSPHKLRATAQNYFNYELQLPFNVIAVILGHKKVETTIKHYNSLDEAQVESYLENKFREVK
jgi:integrase